MITKDFSKCRGKLKTGADPQEVAERLALLADAMRVCDIIIGEVWDALPDHEERQVESFLKSAPTDNYGFDFGDASKRLLSYAEAWMDQIEETA